MAARRFLIAELVWAIGILVVLMPAALLDADPPLAARLLNWFTRALGLAAFPAGISVASDVFAAPRPRRALLSVLAAAGVAAIAVLALDAWITPLVADPTRALSQLAKDMGTTSASWETRNHAAWAFYRPFLGSVNTLLFAAIGLQVGTWATRALPLVLRRVLYWAVGLGLLVTGYTVSDTTYETIVLYTQADASFAAFYTLLIPLSICAGLALPTLALLRRPEPTS